MSFLQSLHRRFMVGATEPGSSDEDVAALSTFATRQGLVVPCDYLELVREVSELELVVDQRGCVRFWSASGVVEMNEAYEIQRHIPHALAVGDDEGGKALAFMDGGSGTGLYRFPFADPDASEAVFIAPTIRELLKKGEGADLLFDWMLQADLEQ